MPIDPDVLKYIEKTQVEEARMGKMSSAYLSKRSFPGIGMDPHVPEWWVGPRDVSQREIADAYNFLSRKGKLSKGLSLSAAAGTPEMEAELYRRGLIAKEFMPAGRIDPLRSTLEPIPKGGEEIRAAIKRVPAGLKKYEKNPELLKRILRGQYNKYEEALLPDITATWERKIGNLSAPERRNLVARLRGHYDVPGKETIISNVDDVGRLLNRRTEVAALQQEGRMSYVNPLDVGGITERDIRPDLLSEEIAKRHIRTGAFKTQAALTKKSFRGMSATQKAAYLGGLPPLERSIALKGLSTQEIGALTPFGGYKKVWAPNVGYVESGEALARYLPGTGKEEKFLRSLMPDLSGEVPVDYRNIQLGTAQDAIETQAIRSTSIRRRQVITRERDGAVSAFYSSKPRAAALRRARGREIMGRAAVAPGAGRAAAQASTALTGINQSIKESALLPDTKALGAFIPKGATPLDLRPVRLAEELGEDIAAQYTRSAHGIEVGIGGKRIGWVPYGKRGAASRAQYRAGKEGSLIKHLMGRGKIGAYLERFGKGGGKPWARMTILQETAAGRVVPIRNVPLAGITFGELGQLFPGQAEQITKRAASRTSQIRGSEFLKSWMSKIPARWKIGAAAVGITLGALMLRRKEKATQPLILEPGEYPDASLYGGLRGGTTSPEGMEEEDLRGRMRDRVTQPRAPMSYNARIEDPNAIQTNIRIKSGTKRRTDFEAVGRAMGLVASDRSGAQLGNVNVRVTDNSRRMSDDYIGRKLARLM